MAINNYVQSSKKPWGLKVEGKLLLYNYHTKEL